MVARLLCEYLLVTQLVSLARIDAKPIEAKLGFSECQAQTQRLASTKLRHPDLGNLAVIRFAFEDGCLLMSCESLLSLGKLLRCLSKAYSACFASLGYLKLRFLFIACSAAASNPLFVFNPSYCRVGFLSLLLLHTRCHHSSLLGVEISCSIRITSKVHQCPLPCGLIELTASH